MHLFSWQQKGRQHEGKGRWRAGQLEDNYLRALLGVLVKGVANLPVLCPGNGLLHKLIIHALMNKCPGSSGTALPLQTTTDRSAAAAERAGTETESADTNTERASIDTDKGALVMKGESLTQKSRCWCC